MGGEMGAEARNDEGGQRCLGFRVFYVKTEAVRRVCGLGFRA
jgi:hypothetical protein